MNDEYSIYKVLLLGDSTVGKTCILMRYKDKLFQPIHSPTLGLDYGLVEMKLKNGKNIKLQIWDTAGQDRFKAITKNYYKGANGVILIYDITSIQTYENIKNWVSQVREEASDNIVVYIVANKIDMEEERKVPTEDGQKLADSLGYPFLEVSAKSGENVSKIFENIVEDIDKIYVKNENGGGKINNSNKKGRKCCM